MSDLRFTAAESAAAESAAAATVAEDHDVESLHRDSLELGYYAPQGHDPQQPHDRDEVSIVVSGHGSFRCGDDVVPFAAGDARHVPAGVDHRFEEFGDDTELWVVFSGSSGDRAESG